MTKAAHDVIWTSLSDGELAQLSQGGDGAAFAAIIARHNQRLYRTARGILRDDAEAEDALQEAYVLAYRALPGFRGQASLSTWLTRIVINEALGRVRRRKSFRGLEVLDTAPERANVVSFPGLAGPNPEVSAARAEVRRLLEKAIDGLPVHFRLVFVMRDMDGLSTEDTASALGILPETVKTRLHRARRLLRESLRSQLSGILTDAFPFGGMRCARMAAVVLKRLGLTAPE